MKRQLLILPLLLLVFLQAGCSFSYSYVVINSNKGPITVELHFKKHPLADEGKKMGFTEPDFLFVEPKLKRVEDLKKQIAWQPLTAQQVVRNDAKGEMIITLQPNEALKVYQDSGTAINAANHSSEETKAFQYFPIADITLTGSKGRMMFEGDVILSQFREFTKYIYQIRYD